MNIEEPKPDNPFLVQVGLLNNDQPFRAKLLCTCSQCDSGYGYYIKCEPNDAHIDVTVRETEYCITDFNDGEWILVFNVKQNGLGIMRSDEMVEPVDMNVIVERK
jgi:hypothetical protein